MRTDTDLNVLLSSYVQKKSTMGFEELRRAAVRHHSSYARFYTNVDGASRKTGIAAAYTYGGGRVHRNTSRH
jgi:hypothetical protein